MEFRNHRLPREHLDRLADGEGSPETIRILLAGERSRRLLLLRALLDDVSRRPGVLEPLPPLEDAWNALVAAHEADPAALAEVVLSPQLGTWVSRMMRLLHGGAAIQAPPWVELGYLHAAAFVAAFRAGIPLATRLPASHGRVFLPALGMARLPAVPAWNMAEAETADGHAWLWCEGQKVTIPENPQADGPDWWALRRVSVSAGGRVLDVSIDDLDPYRDLADPVPPARLDAADWERWRAILADAWRLIDGVWPAGADAMSVGLVSIVPLPGDNRETRSASSGDAFGAALISRPADPVTLAVSMVHEFEHIKLGGLLHLAPLLAEHANSVVVYAPWRDDPRPLAGLLQGIHAFCGIAGFWARYRLVAPAEERAVADFEFAYARRQTRMGLATLLGSPLLTDVGRRFALGVAARVRAQSAQRIPREPARAAWAAAIDHRAGWRIRHLRPDPDRVHRLADAFLAGRPARAVDAVRCAMAPDTGGRWHQSRLALHRIRLHAPERFRRLATRDDPIPAAAYGAVWADIALVGGSSTAAEAAYRAMIATDPGDITAWTGLAVATAANHSTSAWRLLIRRPELIRVVYLAVREHRTAISPTAVAEWLDADSPHPGRSRLS